MHFAATHTSTESTVQRAAPPLRSGWTWPSFDSTLPLGEHVLRCARHEGSGGSAPGPSPFRPARSTSSPSLRNEVAGPRAPRPALHRPPQPSPSSRSPPGPPSSTGTGSALVDVAPATTTAWLRQSDLRGDHQPPHTLPDLKPPQIKSLHVRRGSSRQSWRTRCAPLAHSTSSTHDRTMTTRIDQPRETSSDLRE